MGGTGKDSAGIETGQTQAVEELMACINRHPRRREILYKTLGDLRQRSSFEGAEQRIQEHPEFSKCLMSPAGLLDVLKRAGGVVYIAVKEDGSDLTDEERDGLSDDAIDDLIDHFDVETTTVGVQVLEIMHPANRYNQLLFAHPDQAPGYEEVLRFYAEKKRRRQEVEALVQGKDYCIATTAEPGLNRMRPSHFLEKLEKVGMIEWNNGWTASTAALEMLRKEDGFQGAPTEGATLQNK